MRKIIYKTPTPTGHRQLGYTLWIMNSAPNTYTKEITYPGHYLFPQLNPTSRNWLDALVTGGWNKLLALCGSWSDYHETLCCVISLCLPFLPFEGALSSEQLSSIPLLRLHHDSPLPFSILSLLTTPPQLILSTCFQTPSMSWDLGPSLPCTNSLVHVGGSQFPQMPHHL